MKTTAVYFSVQDKVDLKKREDYYSGLLFSTGQVHLKKKHEDYSGLLFRTAVRFVWRIAPKYLMTMTEADQLLVDLGGHFVFLVFAGLSTTCTSPSDASPTLLFFGEGLPSPAKSTISQSFWATRSTKEMPAPPPAALFSVGLRSSPAYLTF